FKPIKYKIMNPWDIQRYYMDSLRYLKKEVFKAVLLNTKNEIIKNSNADVVLFMYNSFGFAGMMQEMIDKGIV
ncbi:JAB domain-containing protein, partial [Clostridioides difficile]|uniref:JAB domain-containing protein n=1 Tax=Clostridioides difficile TaxID=1496 RepID=UPI00234FC60F